jgi:DNA-binding Lrp family transcriptional regulator
MTTFDRLDAEIIGKLERNARIGIAQLASELGVSRNTIQARMTRLEESGALRGVRPDLDLAEVGLPVQAYIKLEIEQWRLSEIIGHLEAVPEILEARTQAGREDIVALVASSSVSDLQRIAIDLVNIPGVRHTDTTLIIKTVVPYRVWPLLDRLTSDKGWGRSTPPPR